MSGAGGDNTSYGMFIPTYFGASTTGTTTYTTQIGHWTKIGKIIYVSCHLTWTECTGTGNAQIGGHPFSFKSDLDQQLPMVHKNHNSNPKTHRGFEGTTVAGLYTSGGNIINCDNAATIFFSGTYLID